MDHEFNSAVNIKLKKIKIIFFNSTYNRDWSANRLFNLAYVENTYFLELLRSLEYDLKCIHELQNQKIMRLLKEILKTKFKIWFVSKN